MAVLQKFWDGLRWRETPVKTVLAENSPISVALPVKYREIKRRNQS